MLHLHAEVRGFKSAPVHHNTTFENRNRLDSALFAFNAIELVYRNLIMQVDSVSVTIGDEMKFGVVVEKDEDGYYVASVPQLPGCHTQAKTLDQVMKRIKEAIQACLEAEGLKAEGHTELVGVQFIEVQSE